MDEKSIETIYREVRELTSSTPESRLKLDDSSEEFLGASAQTLFPGVVVLPLKTPTLPPATRTNCYVLGDENLIIVDPGAARESDLKPLLDYLEGEVAKGKTVDRVVLTHHHGDHIGGAKAVAKKLGVAISAHERTAALLPSVCTERLRPEATLCNQWKVIFTPGHAPGHICLWNSSQKIAVVGDMVAGVGTILIDPDGGNMGEYISSLQLLARLDASWVLPAHGLPIEGGTRIFNWYVKHRLAREQGIVSAIQTDGPQSASELAKSIYPSVEPAVRVLAVRQILSHLEKLKKEGRVVLIEGRYGYGS